MNTSNPLRGLAALGQSVWIDYIERSFVGSGELARLMKEDGVAGVTSNPAIFHQAIVHDRSYATQIERMARKGLLPEDVYEALVIEDIRSAADVLQPVFTATGGVDGYVSLEVSPLLAYDEEETVRQAKRLARLVNRSNLMIKVPATSQGVAAMRRLLTDGLNVNLTLLFSPERYAEAADAHLEALERRLAAKLPIAGVASVASFFLSRIDSLVDHELKTQAAAADASLSGSAAIAFAQAAYARFTSILASPRWYELARYGAKPQRLLWASTGTKDPAYSDVKYVEALALPMTVTTLPLETLAAFRDHGAPRMQTADAHHAAHVLNALARLGLDQRSVAEQLEQAGVQKFRIPFNESLQWLEERFASFR